MTMLEIETFLPLVEQSFTLNVGLQRPLSLQLVSVNAYPPRAVPVGLKIRAQGFRLLFCGPHQPALPQGTYELGHEALAFAETAVFLVPIKEDENGRYYEAIFN